MADRDETGARDPVALDRDHVWHPYTQVQGAPAPVEIVSARGATLTAGDGTEYLDLISSWWVTTHGHAHPAIAAAVAEQAARLEQVIFAGFTHAPAARLAGRLSALLPEGLGRVFFSDNGSTAVEVALKMAIQYWRNRGEGSRRRLAAFSGGYHGDTLGAMSVGAGSGFFTAFEDLLFEADLLPFPATWHGDNEAEETEAAAVEAVRRYLDAQGEQVAAVIIEPLVQGAGGMRMCRPEFLRALEAAVREAGALLILDEVMTGFGRTGAMFACEKAGVRPDLICLSKGLTGGFLPLAATACREEIYEAFMGEGFERAFAHGHSFTANPLGCAAALASLDLFGQEDSLARVAAMEEFHRARLAELMRHPQVRRPRVMGSIAAFDVEAQDAGYTAAVGGELKRFFMERGLLIRPLGNVVYLMPPYCIGDDELSRAYDVIAEALRSI
jgi:adenosylmethionine-8-amino-7-oxononanoate aminotransferase